MREIRTLRATWRGLETWCGSGPPGHNDAPALDPTCGSRGRATASGDPVGEEKSSSLPRPFVLAEQSFFTPTYHLIVSANTTDD
jgi:hypothetical protein